MFPSDEMKNECRCSDERHPHAILFNILSRKDNSNLSNDNWNHYSTRHNCHCEQRRVVCLKDPEKTCQAASGVLVKTIRFMKSLPSFHHLPHADQLSLLRNCWVPLFVLGLAQERIAFEVTDVPAASILRGILLNGQQRRADGETEGSLPTLAGVHKLKSCLHKLWSLNLTPKEYAYLKGALLFKPDIPGLKATTFIEGLQQEAQRVLHEVIRILHPGDWGRFSQVLLAASTLQTVAQSLLTELFLRPIVGQTDLIELLTEILFTK